MTHEMGAEHRHQQAELIRDLRRLVVNYQGRVEESPHYAQLARLLVNECILDEKYRKPNK